MVGPLARLRVFNHGEGPFRMRLSLWLASLLPRTGSPSICQIFHSSLRRLPAALALEQFVQDTANLAQGLVASGLVNDALDAPIETAAVLCRQVLAGHHYDRNVVPLRPTAHFVHELEAIHFGHDEIENNRVRAGLVEARQRDPAVLRLGNIPSVMLEVKAHLTSDG